MYPPNQGGMRTTDRGSTTGAASWTDRARSERAAPKGRAKRVNPPLTAIFKLRACTEVRAFCLYVSPKPRGDENHRPGFDTKTPGAFLNRACSGPEGARPRDGLSSGAASWTDRAHSERAAPKGRAKRVNPPPHRHIQERARTKVRAFVSKLLVFTVIFLMKGLFLDLWLLHQTYYRLCKTALLPYLKRFRKVCISISR